MLYIYLSLSLLFFITAFLIVKIRMIYLNNNSEKYDSYYDGHSLFLDSFFKVINFFVKKIYFFIKIIYQNILHFWVILIEKIKFFLEKTYTKSRNKFMKEIVKDKKAVPQFWQHLKRYKKEIDEEKEEIN